MNKALTAREMQVLSLMRGGLNRVQIAKILCISPSAIGQRTTQIFRKLDVRNSKQAVAYAIRAGLIVPDEVTR